MLNAVEKKYPYYTIIMGSECQIKNAYKRKLIKEMKNGYPVLNSFHLPLVDGKTTPNNDFCLVVVLCTCIRVHCLVNYFIYYEQDYCE